MQLGPDPRLEPRLNRKRSTVQNGRCPNFYAGPKARWEAIVTVNTTGQSRFENHLFGPPSLSAEMYFDRFIKIKLLAPEMTGWATSSGHFWPTPPPEKNQWPPRAGLQESTDTQEWPRSGGTMAASKEILLQI